MDSFEWQPQYETGIDLIDTQHKELFEKINGFLLAIYKGDEQYEILNLTNFLEKYVELHFSTEERLFQRYLYPHKEEHMKEHSFFRMLVKEISADVRKRKTAVSYAVEVDNKLKSWWDSHILQTDMKYVPFLKEAMKKDTGKD